MCGVCAPYNQLVSGYPSALPWRLVGYVMDEYTTPLSGVSYTC